MKSKEVVISKLFAVLAELQSGLCNPEISESLRIELRTLNDILDDKDIPERYWDDIESCINGQ